MNEDIALLINQLEKAKHASFDLDCRIAEILEPERLSGNMLPAWVRVVCVDINRPVPTKVSDRGTGHAVGVVTDVGLFLDVLARKLGLK